MRFTRFALLAALTLGICRLTLQAQTTTTGTALTRHAPSISGTVEGSVQQMSGQNVALDGGSIITHHLRVPGSPIVLINGRPTFGGTVVGSGAATPSNYGVTLSGNARLGALITQTNPVLLASVAPPPLPTGTRTVVVNASGQSVGLWSTLRNLTLNGNVGEYVVPPGTYGDFTAHAGTGFTLGVAGAAQPSIYNFQHLTLNGQCRINVVGPVIVTVANSVVHNGRAGTYLNPQWLELRIAAGGLIVNGNSGFYGYVLAPNGGVVVAGRGELSGGIECDNLTVQGGGLLRLWIRNGTRGNQPPVANAQPVVLNEDIPTPIALSASDPDNGTLTYTVTVPPLHGSLDGSAPNLTYTPALHYYGPDSFAFTASDGAATSEPATISITVNPVNDAPAAHAQIVTVSEDGQVPIVLTGTDIEGASLCYSVVAGPQHGTLTGAAPLLAYTPNPDFSDEDSFTFRVNDGELDSVEATVLIHVTPIFDVPTAIPLSLEIWEDEVGTITLSGSDADGDVLTFEVVLDPVNGVLGGASPTLSYTPNPDYYGDDFFTYTATDGLNTSTSALVEISIFPKNDAPEAIASPVETDEDTAVSVTLGGRDVDGDSLTYQITEAPRNGDLTGTAPNLTYTPYANYHGPDGFAFVVNDGQLNSAPAAVAIVARPINDSPLALPQTVTTLEDDDVAFVLSATDEDGDGLAFEIVTAPGHGTVAATGYGLPEVVYSPAKNFNGPDEFTFRVFDGSVWSEPVAVMIQVEMINEPPVVLAGVDQTLVAPEVITLAGSAIDDEDTTPFTVTWTKLSGPGDVTFSDAHSAATTATYSASGVFVLRLTGDDGEFVISDDVQVTVNRPNQPPVVVIGADQRLPWGATANLQGSATDDGLPLGATLSPTWSKLSGPGAVTFSNTNNLSTAASFDAAGDYVIRLRVSDSQFTGTGTVKISVSAPNQVPGVNAGSDREAKTGESVVFVPNVSDDGLPSGAGISTAWSKVSGPGTVNFSDPFGPETACTFLAPGSYVVRLTATDGELTSHDDVTVTVSPPPNQAPVVSAGADQTLKFFLTAQLRGSASDDGQIAPLSVAWTKVSGPGVVTFSNAANVNTAASFSQSGVYVLRLSAGDGALSAADEVVVTLTGENQPPSVDAGPDQVVSLGTPSALAALVADDGLPTSGTLALTWSKVSGPGAVSFGNSGAANTTVTISADGLYELQLTVGDGEFTTSDRLEVTVDCAKLSAPAGLVGLWKGEDNVRDSLAYNVGTLLNGTSFTDGFVDRAFQFDGTNDDIAITASPTNDVGASLGFTVECWVKPTTLSGFRPIVEWGQNGTGVHLFASVINTGTLYANIVEMNGAGHTFSTPANTLITGVWQHVALTYSKTTGIGRIYKNGVLVSQATLGSFTPRTTADLHIGARIPYVWSGALDEVSVYNRDLMGAEIQSIHGVGACGKTDSLPAEYPMLAVRAGADQTIGWPQSAPLAGTLIDRRPGSDAPSIEWIKLSGPGDVRLPESTSLSTPAFFSEPGTYVVRLSARAGDLEAFDDLTVKVTQESFRHIIRLKSGNGTANDPLNRYSTNGGATWLPASLTGNSSYALLPGTSYITGQFVQFSSARIRARWVLPAAYANPALNMQYYADNAIRVHLNGTQFAQTPAGFSTAELQNYAGGVAFTAPASSVTVSAPDLFHAGENLVELENFNSFGPMGVDYVVEVSYDAPGVPGNVPPQVFAGPNRIVTLPSQISLAGTVSDDGLALPDYIETIWEVVSGAGSAAFSNARVLNPTVTVSTAGDYVFRLIARDGEYTVVDTVSATVFPNTGPNSAPVVEAGADFSGTDLNSLPVAGFVSDDGRPLVSPVVAWRKLSGPGTVAFANEHAAATSVVFATAGTYVLELSARDGLLTGSDTVTVHVQPSGWSNLAPSVSAGPDRTVQLPQGQITLAGNATDDVVPEGRSLTYHWEFVSTPGAATLAEATTRTVTAQFLDAGLYVLRLTASDGLLSSGDEVAITVLPVPNPDPGNGAPVVHAGADRLVPGLGPVTIEGTVSDDGLPAPANLSVQWAKVSGPGLVSFSAAQTATTQVSFNYPGVYVLRLSARDGLATASDDIQLTVGTGGNQPPMADAGPDQTTNHGQSIKLLPQLNDDGLPTGYVTLAWTVIDGPGMVNFAGTADELTVDFEKVGTYTLRLTVDDDQLNASDDVVVTVTPGSLAAPTVALTSPIDGQLMAFDQSIQLAATASASGVGIDYVDFYADGTFLGRDGAGPFSFTWTPPTAGPHSVIARAFDDLGVSAETAAVGITVGPPAPKITLTYPISYSAFAPGQSLTFQATASPARGGAEITNVEFLLDGSVIGVDANAPYSVATTTPAAIGDHTVSARVTDANGLTSSTSAITFRVAADPTAPLIAELAPEVDGAGITAPTQIFGTVSGPTLRDYVLEYRQIAECSEWVTFASCGQPATGTALGTFDPTLLINGVYEIRLTAHGAYGVAAGETAMVAVEGDMKVGHFAVAFQDLQVPLAGVPLTVVRTYDSREYCPGDFGYGWRLDVESLRLEKNAAIGSGWGIATTVGTFSTPSTYQLVDEATHLLTVRMPDGEVLRFRPKLTVDRPYNRLASMLDADGDDVGQAWLPFQYRQELKLTYRPLGGTKGATLRARGYSAYNPWFGGGGGGGILGDAPVYVSEPLDGPIELATGDNSGQSASLVSDANGWDLTVKDGRVFEFDAQGRLESMSDPLGNTLTFMRNTAGKILRVVHSSGAQVVFHRNGDGLIERITDPRGNELHYSYDTAGHLRGFWDREADPATEQATQSFTYKPGTHLLEDLFDGKGIRAARSFYDGDGRLQRTVDADGNETIFTHSIAGRTETIRDRAGKTTVHRYDERGNVVETQTPDGTVTQTAYHTWSDGRKSELKTEEKITGLFTQLDGTLAQRTVTTRYAYEDDDPATPPANDGLLRKITDPLTHTTRLSYDGQGNLLTITDPLYRTTSNTYYPGTNLVATTTDAAGHVTSFTYDGRGMLDRETRTVTVLDETGATRTDTLVTDEDYDAAGYLVRMVDPLCHETTYENDLHGNRLFERTTRTVNNVPVAVITEHEYDAQDRLVRTWDPEHLRSAGNIPTSETVYDENGKVAISRDGLARETSMSYDNRGHLTTTVFADATIETVAYDAEGRREFTTNRRGKMTQTIYDALGRVTDTVFLGSGGDTDVTLSPTRYDAAGRVYQSTDANDHTTTNVYDDAGRRVATIDALTHTTGYEYDDAGNLGFFTDAKGRVTEYKYDDLNRRTRCILPAADLDVNGDGVILSAEDNVVTSTQTGYDELGRRVSETDANGRTKRFVYDKLGRLRHVVDTAEQVTSYGYDELGNQLTQTDANNHTTKYGYDSIGRRISRTLPMGQSESMIYSAVGNLSQRTDFNGTISGYTYDALNRLLTRTSNHANAAASNVSFTYTATGQRETMTDASGVTSYGYDSRDRLTTKATPQGTLTYSYDDVGNVTSITSSNTNGVAVTYRYDDLNRLHEVEEGEGEITHYTYDEVGNLRSFATPNGVVHGYGYNALNRLTDLYVTRGAATLANYNYTQLRTGHRSSAVETFNSQPSTLNRNLRYTYDSLYRLTNETISSSAGPSGTVSYGLDPVGNRQARTSTVAGLSSQSFTYDANDRLQNDGCDANGNTTTGHVTLNAEGAEGPEQATSDTYDSQNRLTTRTGSNSVQIVYDGDGNKVRETLNGQTIGYLIDTLNPTAYAQVLEELQNGTVIRTYTFGHDLLVQDQRDGGGAWNATWYGYDGHGSIRFLATGTAQVIDRYDYDAFGIVLQAEGVTQNSFLYCGERFEKSLGLYNLRARAMNVANGRFWSADNYEGTPVDPITLHRYLYANADPVNGIDPSGNATLIEKAITMAQNSVVVALAAIRPAFTIGRAVGGAALRELGLVVEAQVGHLLRLLGAKLIPRLVIGGPAAYRVIDYLVKVGDRIAALEVKYKLPSRAGEGLTRLTSQLQLASSANLGQVVLFTFKEPTAAELQLVLTALGPNANAIQFVFGFNGLVRWFTLYFE